MPPHRPDLRLTGAARCAVQRGRHFCLTLITATALTLQPTLALAQSAAAPSPGRSAPAPATNISASTRAPAALSNLDTRCRVEDEAAFEARIREVSGAAFAEGIRKIDFDALIADQWRDNRMDALVAELVDRATEDAREQSDWSDLVSTLVSSESAKKLANDMALRVYRSDKFKAAVTELVEDASRELAGGLELTTIDAAEPTLECVRAFVGARYGRGMARIVSGQTAGAFDPALEGYEASVGTSQVVLAGSEAIAGALVLLVRRTLMNMARRVGQRIVGAVLSRIVAVVTGGIGVVLIAKDLWDLRNGALPIIADEMKSDTAAKAVRTEIAGALQAQMNDQVADLSAAVANRIVGLWREFQVAHAKVVDLTREVDTFKAFVNRLEPDRLSQLDRVVSVIAASSADATAAIEARLADGSLQRAVGRLPPAAIDIAVDRGDLEAAFVWSDLAEGRIDEVAAYEVHRRAQPAVFTTPLLHKMLDLGQRRAIDALLSISAGQRNTLLNLDPTDLKALTEDLTAPQLAALADYAATLSGDARNALLIAIKRYPERLGFLSATGVQSAILRSGDQTAAVGFALQPATAFNPFAYIGHAREVIDGRIDPYLLWAKHPVVTSGAGILILILLMILWRLLFGGRRTREKKA